ncbi:MAG: hypothetical protein JW950_07900 [Deltaproteobacteria bacterium]|nr:hypothetical protein [Deltaproteobacteria bacterium]
MKKTLGTLMVAGAVVLLTAAFGFAEFASSGVREFPYFQFGCLVVGGLIVISLKLKHDRMYVTEAAGAFALYTALLALFTDPVVTMIRGLVG